MTTENKQPSTSFPVLKTITGLVVLGVLFWISTWQALLFHSLTELFSIVIAGSIFILTWNSRRFFENDYLYFTGVGMLFVGFLDLIHTLAYRNMGVFPGLTVNEPTQLWIAARYTQSLALLIAPLFLRRRIDNPLLLLLGYTAWTGLILASIFLWKTFPDALVPTEGDAGQLTPFKIASEYIIVGILAVAAWQMHRRRATLDPQVLRYLYLFFGFSILSELSFTNYANVFSLFNVLGHLLKIVAFFSIYKAILETGFLRPFQLLFRDLARREEELRLSHADLERRVEERTLALRDEVRERQQAQRELQQAKDELEQRVIDRTAQLQAANRELERELAIRHRVEDALRQSEARLRRLAESNIIGVIYKSRDGRVTEANQAYLDMIGYTRADLQAGRVRWDRITAPEYLEKENLALQEADERGACQPYEKDYLRSDGDRVTALVGFASLELPGHYIGFVLDLTESKKAERALKEYALKLEHSNRELEQFAFVASHDLQEPLRKISTFGSRLRDRVASRLDEEERLYLDRILDASGRMRHMINDLLALSRVTTQGQPFEQVDLNQVVADVLSDLEVQIERTRGQVYADPLPSVDADPVQMRQLFQNLIGNALKFHKNGVPPAIHLTCRHETYKDQPALVLTVQDNGIGFDIQYLERIFQPFQRLHGKSTYEGSGIGLAICRKIVERHGGTITAESQPDQGTAFIVILPTSHEEVQIEGRA